MKSEPIYMTDRDNNVGRLTHATQRFVELTYAGGKKLWHTKSTVTITALEG